MWVTRGQGRPARGILLVCVLVHACLLVAAATGGPQRPAPTEAAGASWDAGCDGADAQCRAEQRANGGGDGASPGLAHDAGFTSRETLSLRRLPGRTGEAPLVAATFRFRTGWTYTVPMSAAAQQRLFTHYSHIARPLGRMLQRHRVHELQLALTAGRWRAEWGAAPGPAGAQLLVWLAQRGNATGGVSSAGASGADDSAGGDAAHIDGFSNALAGLYCASLNLITPDTMVSPDPERGWRPRSPHLWSWRAPAARRRRRRDRRGGVAPSFGDADGTSERCRFQGSGAWTGGWASGATASSLRASAASGAGGSCVAAAPLVGSLPREAVCTENLTPLMRLLPCRQRAGLATLLNPLKCVAPM